MTGRYVLSHYIPSLSVVLVDEQNIKMVKRKNVTHDKAIVNIVASLKTCANQKDLYKGTRLHAVILQSRLLGKNLHVANTLVSMYAKCGALAKAHQLLDDLPVRDVVTWSALIAGYAQYGHLGEALNCFERMQHEGIFPNAVTFISILKACAAMGATTQGKHIHVRQQLPGTNVVLATALVDMYAKCGALPEAQELFNELPGRNVVTWSALIAGYAQHGHGEEALNCFERMKHEGFYPDAVTFICILKACAAMGAVTKGKQIHEQIVRQGLLGTNVVLTTALMDMYAKCSELSKARQVLDELPIRDLVSWNALIAGYVKHGHGEEALHCFQQMQLEGLYADSFSFVSILKACAILGAVTKGKQIHGQIFSQRLLATNILLCNALVDMYAKCGALPRAQEVLEELPVHDVVTWSALISGYVQHGHCEEALHCFEQMQVEGLCPDAVTFICVLRACAIVEAAMKGKQIHDQIVRQGLLGTNNALGNALVDMYAKCGALSKAQQVLEVLPVRDVVTWSALISGYAQHGYAREALDCFERMQQEGLCPDAITFACILKACAIIGAVSKGKQVHDQIVRQGLLGTNTLLATALVHMYAKCGALSKAQQVLDELPVRDVVTWSALIAGYAHAGHGEEALNCFERMQHEGLCPNAVTYVCVLSACNHSGLLDEAQKHFENMSTDYRVTPDLEHYSCMVDLFGCLGHVDKAIGVIKKLQYPLCLPVWAALLGACRKWGNVKLGRVAFEHAVQSDITEVAAHVSMSNNKCSG